MLVSYKNKFIFIHNNKTGGTSIKTALLPHCLVNPPLYNHKINRLIETLFVIKLPLNYLRKGLGPIGPSRSTHYYADKIKTTMSKSFWNSCFKFGFVRNPWSRLVSSYNHIKRDHRHWKHQIVQNMSFDEFLNWKINPKYKIEQYKFFYNTKGICLVDFIGKLENIKEDFEYICDKINIKTELPHYKKKKQKHGYYKTYYNKKSIDFVANHYKKDIKLFNYSF